METGKVEHAILTSVAIGQFLRNKGYKLSNEGGWVKKRIDKNLHPLGMLVPSHIKPILRKRCLLERIISIIFASDFSTREVLLFLGTIKIEDNGSCALEYFGETNKDLAMDIAGKIADKFSLDVKVLLANPDPRYQQV